MASATPLTTDWGEMAYSDTGGSGKPLLFLHGTGCDSADWVSVIERLPRDQHHITLDFRGHGLSTVPTEQFTLANLAADVLHLVNSIGIDKIILAGHSLGGMVAMEVAKRSSCIAGLILLEGWTSLASAGSAFDTGRFYGSLSETEIKNIQRKAEDTRNRFKLNVWDFFWTSVQDFDAYVYLEQSYIPIYEVFGEMGRNELTEQKLRIPLNPNIEVIWVPNAGHYLPHEYPVAVSDICINFVETFS